MVHETGPVEGGCLCGTVRYRIAGKPVLTEFCHCESCRRASGAPIMAWAGFRRSDFALVTGEPSRFLSSEGVGRSFCGQCGTTLTYDNARFPDDIYIAIGSLDAPESMPPERHIHVGERLSWLELADSLPHNQHFLADES